MGNKEVLKILDETATALIKKAENMKQEDSMDYIVASTMIMNQYLYMKMKMKKK